VSVATTSPTRAASRAVQSYATHEGNGGIAVMNSANASAAGQFKMVESTINRLGYGGHAITGDGIWGPPPDRQAALATLAPPA